MWRDGDRSSHVYLRGSHLRSFFCLIIRKEEEEEALLGGAGTFSIGFE